MKRRNKKGALEFSFAWIFALVAGGFILFLAIFGIIKYINIEGATQSAETAKSISVFLNPLESSFETGGKTSIKTPLETKIYASCISSGNFGKQIISTSEFINKQWSSVRVNISSQNRYVFSENYAEGKKFYIYSKSFEFPFKIADLIYLTSAEDNYCFLDAPDEIEDEITGWKPGNILFEEESCPHNSIKICFSYGMGCNIVIDEEEKSVKKGAKKVYYEGEALMYAAIFSEGENYECQLIRLMKRGEQLSSIYKTKSTSLLSKIGCEPELIPDLIILNDYMKKFDKSEELNVIGFFADEIQRENEYAECKLW